MKEEDDDVLVTATTNEDLPAILWLFRQAMTLQGKNGYKVWEDIDQVALQKDIDERRQYKLVRGHNILGIFSILNSDPFIWGERDQNDAVYVHRIVTNPDFKGQKQFQKVLNWASQYAVQNKKKFIRMDTWADNPKIIQYYSTFGFKFMGNFTTPDSIELPIQNRNLNVALLELQLDEREY